MEKLSVGFEFIFASYRRAALVLTVTAFVLAIPITVSLLGQQQNLKQTVATKKVLGINTKDGPLLAQETTLKPNLYMTGVQLRKDAAYAGHPNGDCNHGTLVTEGMTVASGVWLEVCVTYGNNGLVASSGFNMSNYVNQNSQPTVGSPVSQTYGIGPAPVSNSLATELGSITPNATTCATNCHAGVFIDSDNTIAESNENDNFASSVGYNVTPPTNGNTAGTGACVVGENDCPTGQVCQPGGAGSTQGTCVANAAPTTSNAVIAPVPVKADGTTEYKITITSTDPQGGDTIVRQFAMIDSGQRGYIGWSTDNFVKYWGSLYGAPAANSPAYPYTCVSGGGAVAIYGGADYGSQYITTRWCSTSVSGNTRTTDMWVKFNASFNAPTTGNSISAFTEDSAGVYDYWRAFGTFNLENLCSQKSHGDANCDGHIKMDDFDVWKNTFVGLFGATPPSSADQGKVDFNSDTHVDTDDFNIWRGGFLDAALPH